MSLAGYLTQPGERFSRRLRDEEFRELVGGREDPLARVRRLVERRIAEYGPANYRRVEDYDPVLRAHCRIAE